MILPFLLARRWVVRFSLLEMPGPREFYQDGHHDGGEDGITCVVSQPDRKEAKDKIGILPVPKVLMENVNDCDEQKEQEFFSCYFTSMFNLGASSVCPALL